MDASTPHRTQRCSPNPGPAKGADDGMESAVAVPNSLASVGVDRGYSLQSAWSASCSMQTSESYITEESVTGVKAIGNRKQLLSGSLKFSPSSRLNRVRASCNLHERHYLHEVSLLSEFLRVTYTSVERTLGVYSTDESHPHMYLRLHF